jgi:hypothetical protein
MVKEETLQHFEKYTVFSEWSEWFRGNATAY